MSSRSYSVRWRSRCASSMRPSCSNIAICDSSSWRISPTARSIVGREVTYSVAGQMATLSSFERTSPVSGSKCVIASTSSPKNEMRYAVSWFAGWISTTSPFTRKRPRERIESLRTYWLSISLRSASVAVVLLPHLEDQHPLAPLLRRAEPVDAGDGGHDDHVAAREERRRRREPQPRDVVVLRRVLLDVEVGLRDVGLGLVVVVVRDEVLDRVLRGRTRGTRCRAARPASCCARSRARAAGPAR